MKRRARGEGSLHQRPDGIWTGQVSFLDAKGQRQRRTVYARSRAEAARMLDDLKRKEAGQLEMAGRQPKLADFMNEWLRTVADTQKPGTYENYRNVNRMYIEPVIGHIRLDRLAPLHVQSMLDEMSERGLSPRTRQLARSVLRRALRRAEQWGLVQRNVAALVDGPRVTQKEGRTLTPEQARDLLAASRSHQLEPFVAVALACGLRRGEALALRWSDVDLHNGFIAVNRTMARIGGQLIFDEPKTRGSKRRVAMPAACIEVLERHQEAQREWRAKAGERWQDHDLVISTPIGTPIDPANVLHEFGRLSERAGIGRWTPHEMRHSAASLLLAQGVPLEVVSEVLGHSSIRITKDVYGHLLEGQIRSAADAMERTLRPPDLGPDLGPEL